MSNGAVPNFELFRARRAKGLSRGTLADLAGISEKQIGLIERGVARYPRDDTQRNIARALEVDINAIFPAERVLVGRKRRKRRDITPAPVAA